MSFIDEQTITRIKPLKLITTPSFPIESDKNLLINQKNSSEELNQAAISKNKQPDDPYAGVDPLILAYFYIFQAVLIGRDTAQTQAKEVQVNAEHQNDLIFQEANQNFQTLSWSQLHNTDGSSKNVDQGVLENMEAQNQETSAIRDILGDKLNILRQNAQVSETSLNTTVNDSQQSIQQGASLMQMLVSLTNQISRI